MNEAELYLDSLNKLRAEILDAYPHGDDVELREVNSRYFVRWHNLAFYDDSNIDVLSALDDFKAWVIGDSNS